MSSCITVNFRLVHRQVGLHNRGRSSEIMREKKIIVFLILSISPFIFFFPWDFSSNTHNFPCWWSTCWTTTARVSPGRCWSCWCPPCTGWPAMLVMNIIHSTPWVMMSVVICTRTPHMVTRLGSLCGVIGEVVQAVRSVDKGVVQAVRSVVRGVLDSRGASRWMDRQGASGGLRQLELSFDYIHILYVVCSKYLCGRVYSWNIKLFLQQFYSLVFFIQLCLQGEQLVLQLLYLFVVINTCRQSAIICFILKYNKYFVQQINLNSVLFYLIRNSKPRITAHY
jgi:hypothetical protein